MATRSASPPAEVGAVRYPALAELKAALAALGRARRRLAEAGKSYAAGTATVDDVEAATVELLQRVQSVERPMRRMLLAIKIHYATLWLRGGGPRLEDSDWAVGAVEQWTEQTQPLSELCEKGSEGRSRDGRVTAAADQCMRLVELDFEPCLIAEPDYQASLIEAVNEAVRPVFRAFHGALDELMTELPEPELRPWEEEEMPALYDLWGLLGLQEDIAELLSQTSRGEDLSSLPACVEEIVRSTREKEKRARRQIQPLRHYRRLLKAKARLEQLMPEDLADVKELEDLFRTEALDDLGDLVESREARYARAMIEQVTTELELKARHEQDLSTWQRLGRLARYRLASVEKESFEGRSSDGSVAARVAGTVRLIGVTLAAPPEGEPEKIRASVIEAINAAFGIVVRRRSISDSMMVMSPNG